MRRGTAQGNRGGGSLKAETFVIAKVSVADGRTLRAADCAVPGVRRFAAGIRQGAVSRTLRARSGNDLVAVTIC
ncbi:hypothetical protein O7623_08830 [Solwaraspora sp. WMMD791]|uniref:hypothetical protein n=1 Tax=Solwaraspora sp. WMMD791 TaxID=3016086 RepID=UPI00249AD306|nr:hypothetical protein [Solwaraspora sp. WMMD791]WFE29274.1 hypothetical protein O7623_08830 [Solwaraspora sp. WMMD791]